MGLPKYVSRDVAAGEQAGSGSCRSVHTHHKFCRIFLLAARRSKSVNVPEATQIGGSLAGTRDEVHLCEETFDGWPMNSERTHDAEIQARSTLSR